MTDPLTFLFTLPLLAAALALTILFTLTSIGMIIWGTAQGLRIALDVRAAWRGRGK